MFSIKRIILLGIVIILSINLVYATGYVYNADDLMSSSNSGCSQYNYVDYFWNSFQINETAKIDWIAIKLSSFSGNTPLTITLHEGNGNYSSGSIIPEYTSTKTITDTYSTYNWYNFTFTNSSRDFLSQGTYTIVIDITSIVVGNRFYTYRYTDTTNNLLGIELKTGNDYTTGGSGGGCGTSQFKVWGTTQTIITIENSTFNMTSEGGSGCTSWRTSQSTECNTTDYRLKYVEFDTNVAGNCSLQTTSHTYNSSNPCYSTGGTSHKCALNTNDLLSSGSDSVYIGCNDGSNDVQSTALAVNQIAGGSGEGLISCISYIPAQCSVSFTNSCAVFTPI